MASHRFIRPAMLAGLPLLFAAGAANAQQVDTASQTLRLAGTAPAACVLGAATPSAASNAAFVNLGANTGRMTITQLVSPQDATSQASSLELALPVRCNASHRLTVRSTNGGLLRSGAVNGGQRGGQGFSDFLAYDYRVDWAANRIAQPSDSGLAALAVDRPATGDLLVRISTEAGRGPLTAGQYTDAIVIEFQPAG